MRSSRCCAAANRPSRPRSPRLAQIGTPRLTGSRAAVASSNSQTAHPPKPALAALPPDLRAWLAAGARGRRCMRRSTPGAQRTRIDPCRGVAKWPKAPGFDPGIRRFESCRPCQLVGLRIGRSGSHRNGQSAAEQDDARRSQPAGVHRQRQPAAGRSGVQGTRHPPGQGAGRAVLRRRSAGRDRGKRAPAGSVRDPADVRAECGKPGGTAGADRRAQARIGVQRHRGGAVLRLRAAGSPPAFGARADHGQGRGEDVHDRSAPTAC